MSLPTYLAKTGRHSDLIEYLSPDHFAKMIEQSHSLTPVQEQARLGLETALQDDRTRDLMRFGIQRSAVTELRGSDVLLSEIRARMALGQHDASLGLAESAVLKHDRLRLLAAIARMKRDAELPLEPELIEQIDRLFGEADLGALKEQIEELASDLLYVKPELAIKLAEQESTDGPTESKADWALVGLSLTAMFRHEKGDEESRQKTLESIRARIKNPVVAQFSNAIAGLINDYPPEKIVIEAEKIEDPKHRLYFLRSWALTTTEGEGLANVLEYALNLTITTTTFTPDARHFRELATPLPHLADYAEVKSLVGIYDAQKTTIMRLGPTEEYVRLQLILAHAESRFDFEAARSRLIELYFSVSQLEDLAVKSASFAYLVARLPEIDPSLRLEKSDGLHSIAEQEFNQNTKTLLDATADHTVVSHNIIGALATSKPTLALTVAKSLNTFGRRCLAIRHLIRCQLRETFLQIPIAEFEKELAEIQILYLRDGMLAEIWSRLDEVKSNSTLTQMVPQALPPNKGPSQYKESGIAL